MSASNKKRIVGSNQTDSISTETGLKAVAEIAPLAEKEKIEWALAGGLAMHIYGFTRATVDVDVVASAVLPIEKQRSLIFGGESYSIQVEDKSVTLDWIVRSDEFEKLYRLALDDSAETETGLKIIAPEWLVILKFFSGRAKDKLDLQWLLQQENLVVRSAVKSNLTKVVGANAAVYLWQEFQSEFDYADFLKTRETKTKYK